MLNGLFYLAVQVLRRKKSTTIVLAGLSGSGKTVLFYQVSVVDYFFSFQLRVENLIMELGAGV